jgi:hypothetical protein
MKIALLTYGSRGDVQPFLALALGLQKAGFSVRLAALRAGPAPIPVTKLSLDKLCTALKQAASPEIRRQTSSNWETTPSVFSLIARRKAPM